MKTIMIGLKIGLAALLLLSGFSWNFNIPRPIQQQIDWRDSVVGEYRGIVKMVNADGNFQDSCTILVSKSRNSDSISLEIIAIEKMLITASVRKKDSILYFKFHPIEISKGKKFIEKNSQLISTEIYQNLLNGINIYSGIINFGMYREFKNPFNEGNQHELFLAKKQ